MAKFYPKKHKSIYQTKSLSKMFIKFQSMHYLEVHVLVCFELSHYLHQITNYKFSELKTIANSYYAH